MDDKPDMNALVRAQGLAFATLEALLVNRGVLLAGELAGGLAALERSTTPVDAECGDVLAEWAEMLRQVDEAQARARH